MAFSGAVVYDTDEYDCPCDCAAVACCLSGLDELCVKVTGDGGLLDSTPGPYVFVPIKDATTGFANIFPFMYRRAGKKTMANGKTLCYIIDISMSVSCDADGNVKLRVEQPDFISVDSTSTCVWLIATWNPFDEFGLPLTHVTDEFMLAFDCAAGSTSGTHMISRDLPWTDPEDSTNYTTPNDLDIQIGAKNAGVCPLTGTAPPDEFNESWSYGVNNGAIEVTQAFGKTLEPTADCGCAAAPDFGGDAGPWFHWTNGGDDNDHGLVKTGCNVALLHKHVPVHATGTGTCPSMDGAVTWIPSGAGDDGAYVWNVGVIGGHFLQFRLICDTGTWFFIPFVDGASTGSSAITSPPGTDFAGRTGFQVQATFTGTGVPCVGTFFIVGLTS